MRRLKFRIQLELLQRLKADVQKVLLNSCSLTLLNVARNSCTSLCASVQSETLSETELEISLHSSIVPLLTGSQSGQRMHFNQWLFASLVKLRWILLHVQSVSPWCKLSTLILKKLPVNSRLNSSVTTMSPQHLTSNLFQHSKPSLLQSVKRSKT